MHFICCLNWYSYLFTRLEKSKLLLLTMHMQYVHYLQAVWQESCSPIFFRCGNPVSCLGSLGLSWCVVSFVDALFDISLHTSLSTTPFFFLLLTKLFKLITASSHMLIGNINWVMLRCRCIFFVLPLASFISSSECPQWKASKFLRLYLLTCSLERELTRSDDRWASYSSRFFSYFLE